MRGFATDGWGSLTVQVRKFEELGSGRRPRRVQNRHRGESRLSSPATPPDMRVRSRRFRGLRIAIEQARKTKRIKVSDGKRVRQGRTVRQMPGAVRAARRLCSEIPTDTKLT
jgi:hypothetical protein